MRFGSRGLPVGEVTMTVFLTVVALVFGLMCVQSLNQTGAKASAISKVHEDGNIRENLRNLIESMKKNDETKIETYRNVLEQEALQEQQAFHAIKEDLWFARRRNSLYKEQTTNDHSASISNEAAAFKREVPVNGSYDKSANPVVRNESDAVYVNKSQVLRYLLDEGTHQFYFASEGRLFGKLELARALYDFFKGDKYRFENLTSIVNRGNGQRPGDWVEYPVVSLDLRADGFLARDLTRRKEFETRVTDQLLKIARKRFGLHYTWKNFRLSGMIEDMKKKFRNRPVVIVINEYDAPVRNVLRQGATDRYIVRFVRSFMDRAIFAEVFKSRESLKFVFVTGVSRLLLDTMRSEYRDAFVDLTSDKGFISSNGVWGNEVMPSDPLESAIRELASDV